MNIISLVRNLINIFDIFQQRRIVKFLKKKISINTEIQIFDVGAHFGERPKTGGICRKSKRRGNQLPSPTTGRAGG